MTIEDRVEQVKVYLSVILDAQNVVAVSGGGAEIKDKAKDICNKIKDEVNVIKDEINQHWG